MIKFYLLKTFVFAAVVLCSFTAWSQSRVTGKVTSADDGTGLPGVSILEKGTANGTVTDGDGNFSIQVGQNATLVFSFVGYASQEIAVGTQSTINVNLEADVTALGEIVVVGYGEQKREDVTGSIVALNNKDFNRGVLTSPQDLMIGRVAGVSVVTNSGAPGAGSTIRIRGGSSLNASNDPLIVIDGFPVDNTGIGGTANPLASLNPNDIESFTVLKDASATAIYGLRASNGVIIITTKKGKAGKPEIQYNGTISAASPRKLMDVFSGDEYRDFVTQLANDGTVSGLAPAALSRLGEANTDWQKEIYRTGISHDHNLSVSGTYKDVPYRISYGYTQQNGILKNTDVNRNSLNISLTPSLLDDNLKVNANLKTSFSKNNFGNEGAVGSAVIFDPTQPIRNGNTKYGGYFTWTEIADNLPDGSVNPDGAPTLIAPGNPVALIEQTDNRSSVQRYLGNLQLDYRLPFLPDLRANVNAGFDIQKSDGNNNQPVDAGFTFRGGPGSFTHYTGNNTSKLRDIYLNYTKEIGGSRIDATIGHSYQSFKREAKTITRNGAGNVTAGMDTDDDNVADSPLVTINPNDLISLFARINYSFNDKYLLTATLRDDYTSRFGGDNRSGLFPAVSLGWRINQEGVLKNIQAISNLKLRAGYGLTGQQDIGNNPYPYFTKYTLSTPTASYQFGNNFYKTLRPDPYDAKIHWEKTSTLNVALDFGFFNNRLSGSVDVYKRHTSDLINSIPIAAGSNFSNYLTTNIGDLENNGFEVTLNAGVVETSNVKWNVGLNYAHNVNEITKLRQTSDPTFSGVAVGLISGGVGNNIQIHSVGYPANSFYTFEQIYDTNGKPIEGLYVDRTGLGGSVTSNEKNKYHNHSPMAQHLIGINSRLNVKNFDFAFSSRVSLGNYVYNNVQSSNAIYSNFYYQSGVFSNVPTAIKDTNFKAQQLFSDYYVENASFFKLDNIGIGYTVNHLFTEKLRARFSFTAQNALVITKYSGLDPEVAGGIDNNFYPRPKTFLFGINLTY